MTEAAESRPWNAFAAEAPELAEAGRRLLFQFGPGLAYLATVRADGGPRLHPVCPVVTHGGLWVFVGPSPKQQDLRRDGRFAMHSFPCEDVDDEFFVAGTTRVAEDDPTLRQAILDVYLAQGTTSSGDETLVEFLLDRALHAAYGPRPSWPPTYTRWRAA